VSSQMVESSSSELALTISRIERKLQTALPPAVGRQLVDWMVSLSPTGRAADYFTQRSLFPMLRLPVWMAGAAGSASDSGFQGDLAYSTINGYYFIRMIDNVMDGDASVEQNLLPLSVFFHSEFQSVYQRYFDFSHPFWDRFHSLWLASASAVCREAASPDMDLDGFREIAANKMCAAKIPLVAVHYQCGEATELARWLQFADRLAAWWQFFDDLMDWHKDYSRGACVYFLCEGNRKKLSHESMHQWVVREGFQWGVDTLEQWMSDLRESSIGLRSSAVEAFLIDRTHMFRAIVGGILPGLEALAELAAAMDPEPRGA